MDIIDSANELNELRIQAALSNRQPVTKSINGMCIWCEEMPAAPNTHIAVKIAGMIMSNIKGRTEAHKCKQSENSQKSTEEVMKR